MSLASRIISLYRRLRNRQAIEEDLDAEVRSYFEITAERYIARGMSPEEARRTARLECGQPEQIKQTVREGRMGFTVESIVRDFSYAARVLRKTPVFTAIAVLTL